MMYVFLEYKIMYVRCIRKIFAFFQRNLYLCSVKTFNNFADMLMDAKIEQDRAYEAYLDAKEAFDNCRDGYIKYLDDEESYAEELERLMRAMDAAEDAYRMARMEYLYQLDTESRYLYGDLNDGKEYPKGTLEDFRLRAMEAKQRYDDLASDRVPFHGTPRERASELERLREAWHEALSMYNSEYDRACYENELAKNTSAQL